MRLGYLSLSICLLLGSAVLAEEIQHTPTIDIAAIDPIVVKQLARAFTETDFTLKLPARQTKIQVPEEMRPVWAGTKIKFESELNANLTFDDADEKTPGVTLHIVFEENKILIKHSRPGRSKLVGGISMGLDKNSRREFYMSGQQNSGMALFFPPSAENLYAVFICPRQWGSDKPTNTQTAGWADEQKAASEYEILMPSAYELRQTAYSVTAAAIGTDANFGYEGSAEVYLKVSPTLNPSDPFADSVRSRQVLAEVTYSAAAEQPHTPFSLESGQSVGGVEGQVFLHGPAGHNRSTIADRVISVVKTDSPKNVWIKVGNGSWQVKPGPCYLVSTEVRVKEDFEHQESAPNNPSPE